MYSQVLAHILGKNNYFRCFVQFFYLKKKSLEMEHDVILTLLLWPDNEDIAIQLSILIPVTDSFPGGNSESEGTTSW